MTGLKLLLLLAVGCAHALPQEPEWEERNTIFGEELLEGAIFEGVDPSVAPRDVTPVDVALRSSDNPFRLPTTTRPRHYDVLWVVDLSTLMFAGSVRVQLFATEANVTEIVLHSHELSLSNMSLWQDGQQLPAELTEESEYNFLRVQLEQPLQYNPASPVIYELYLEFGAELRFDMYGIYRSWFRNDYTEEVSWMASTQFQATAARSAFPCYDEPSFKATFNITIRRPSTHRSWSCTRINYTANNTAPGFDDDIYHITPVMSTYLLAILVAQYDALEVVSNTDGLLMYDVIARPGAIEDGQGQYAYEVGQRLLAEMSDHTALDFYSVHEHIKMTQAAIPDFGAGAMENWGLLTYREQYLMVHDNHTNGQHRQLVAYILSHEIAHMWFGNLVTCDWWDELWLNEGFARYYQYFLTDWVEPSLGLGIRFIPEQIHTSLLSDAANNPQPLTAPGPGSPASVSAMFSTITYNKGAAVIRMTEHLLGFNVHREGLRNYLVSRSFDTARPIDLFSALNFAALSNGALEEYGAGFSLLDYYRSWTEQPGHPIIHVQVNHQTGDMIVSQRRFNINSGYSPLGTRYIVPLSFATSQNPDFDNTKPTHVLSGSLAIINRGSVGNHWVIFNKQQTGFYRVNYDDYTWDLIVLALRGSERTLIHEFNRAQIVNDVFQFARSGLMSYTRAFNILSFLEWETEYTPWVAAVTGFNWLRNRLEGTPYITELERVIRDWSTRVLDELTYYPVEGETFMRSYLRYMLAPLACNVGAPACLQAANEQFQALRNNGVEVAVDSRIWVYCNALRNGSEADFDFLFQRFQQHNVYSEKMQILAALGCSPHEASLNTFMDTIVEPNHVIRRQDYTSALSSATTGNEGNTQIIFRYMQQNLANVSLAFNSTATPLSYISSRLRTEAEIEEFQVWANASQAELGGAYAAVYAGAVAAQQSIEWTASVAGDMAEYFDNGNVEVSATDPPAPVTTVPVTEPRPDLEEPPAPALPGAASIATMSALLLAATMLASAANMLA